MKMQLRTQDRVFLSIDKNTDKPILLFLNHDKLFDYTVDGTFVVPNDCQRILYNGLDYVVVPVNGVDMASFDEKAYEMATDLIWSFCDKFDVADYFTPSVYSLDGKAFNGVSWRYQD